MMPYDAVSLNRLAGRYSYLEREGLLPLPVKDGITIVVELDHMEWAAECLRLLLLHSGAAVRVIGVAMKEEFPLELLSEQFSAQCEVSFLPYENGNYRINEALAAAGTSFVVLLEDTVMVTPGWLSGLLWPAIDDPAVGAVAPRSAGEERDGKESLHFDNDLELSAYVSHTLERRRGEWHEVEVLSGPCLLVTREILQRVGGLDHSLRDRRYIIADWCLRARQLGAGLVLSDAVYVHVLQPLTVRDRLLNGAARASLDEGMLAYRAKWKLPDAPMDEGHVPVPASLSSLALQPVIPLGRSAVTFPLVTAVIYFEEKWTAQASSQRQLLLQGGQSYGNIRWVSIRDNGIDSSPEFPVHERDAVITVQGEKPWLHALENISALYESEVVVYLSASADYDSEYVARIVEAVQHGPAGLVVSAAAGLAESELQGRLDRCGALVLPLERIGHRGRITPGRIAKREPYRRRLLLYPDPELKVGYLAGAPGRNNYPLLRGEGGTQA